MRLDSDDWMAELFGHRVYRVTEAEKAEREGTWKTTLHSGTRVFAYARVDASDVATANNLSENGFCVVDVTVKFCRTPSDISPSLPRGVQVRAACPADFDRVVEIAGSGFKYSRFHLDPLVPIRLANEIKRAWMESYRLGTRGSGCLVATFEDAVVGFLAIVETTAQIHSIDLIGVDPELRGRGLGRALVETFIHRSHGRASSMEVGTQAANVQSVRLYENCGFRFVGAAYVLHGHFGSDQSTK